MKQNTAYSAQEAEKIEISNWHSDECSINELIRMIEAYHGAELFGICCGTGYLYHELIQYYSKIHAIDLSVNILDYNNRRSNDCFGQQIGVNCNNVAEYLQNNDLHIKSNDLLFKNCLEILDSPQIQEAIHLTEFGHIFLINTINRDKHSFFYLLKKNGFKFVSDSISYITEERLDTLCCKLGNVIETSVVEQEISLIGWLLYYNCNHEEVSKFIDVLDQMEPEQLYEYGIKKEKGQYLLQRYEKVYCIG